MLVPFAEEMIEESAIRRDDHVPSCMSSNGNDSVNTIRRNTAFANRL